MVSILIVNAERTIQNSLRKILERRGHKITGEAEDGTAAVRLARQLKPDLVLMDIVMPGKMDGIEAAKIIYAELDIPVIFTTGYVGEPFAVKVEGAAPHGYPLKPYEEEALTAAIEMTVGKHREKSGLTEDRASVPNITPSIPSIFWLFSGDYGSTVYVSPQVDQIWCVSGDEMSRDPLAFLKAVHPDDLPCVRESIDRQKKGEPSKKMYRIVHPNGAVHWVRNCAFPVCDESGCFSRIVGIAEDVTSHILLEKSLQASENKFFKTFQNAPLLMILIELDSGACIDVNDKFVQVTGFSREEAIGKTAGALGLLSKKDRSQIAAAIRSRGRVENMELYLTARDKRKLCCLYSGEIITIEGRGLILSIAQDITDRKETEDALRQAEIKFRTVAENTYDWEFWLDEAGRFRYNSPSCKRVTGYPAAAFAKEPALFERIIHPDDRELFRRHHEDLESQCRLEGCDFRIFHKDGSIRWIGHVCQPVYDKDGSYLGIRGSNRDITDRKIMEEQWRKSEFIINSAGEFITMINQDYVYEAVSDSYCRAMEKSRGEIIGRTVGEVWGEERFNDVIKNKLNWCFAGNKVNDEDWINLPGLGRRYYHIHYYPYTGQMDRTRRAIVVSHDITELKQAEIDLTKAEKNYRDIVEYAEEGIFRSTREGRFLMANKAIATMLGYESAERLMSAVTDIAKQIYVRPEDRSILLRTIQEAGAVRGFETEYYRKDGSRIWMSVNMRAVNDAQGSLLYYEGLNQDITARKQAEEDRLRMEEQLLQSQKLETIGRLAAGMAHDFNNLIAPIRGFADILLEELPYGDPHRDDLSQIRLAAEMAGNLTRQLLAFGRKQILSLKPVDMRQVVKGVEKLLRRTVREDIRIKIKVPKSLKKVNADISQIEQILVNLAVNAQDAMPDKGLFAIEIKGVRIDADVPDKDPLAAQGDYVLMSISDTGCGMDQATMERIFEPFFTTKEKGRGTGLGLSTVYGIIKQHGGYINVYSEPGRGSTLNIYLPCIRGEKDSELKSKEDEETLRGGPETVLIVEDNDLVLRMTRRALERIGYHVITAADPDQCLRMMASQVEPIHLMLIDVIMPGMNGKELYDRLSLLRPGVDVIYMSGYSEDVISHHGVLDDEVNFIQKPFSTRELARLIRIVLDKTG